MSGSAYAQGGLIKPATGAMVWHGTEVNTDTFAFDLTGRHVAALEDLLRRTQHLPRDAIRREHCDHPALDGDLARLLDEIQAGRGLVLLRGMPVERHPVDDVERMFWILCTHLGLALSQNEFGERVMRVQDEMQGSGGETPRGNKAARELAMHTDLTDIVALLCVREARSGGESQIASSLAVHNDILQRRPDLMPILYRGFPYHRRGEQRAGDPPITPYDVPVFSELDGQISCIYVRHMVMAALAELQREPTDQEIEALNAVREAAARVQFEFRLRAGEAYLANNFTVLHSRLEFVDHAEAERKRLMLRLWLEPARNPRAVRNEVHIIQNEGWRHGVDALPVTRRHPLDFNMSDRAKQLLTESSARSA